MKPLVKIFHNDFEMADTLANELQGAMEQIRKQRQNFYLALSGGNTPVTFFKRLAQAPYQNQVAWSCMHLFWVDERCVPADHPLSNYGQARYNLLAHVNVPEKNIHFLRGEADPEEEARRYAGEIKNTLPATDHGWPQFDWILLGLGSDGHTASLFPGLPGLKEESALCAVAVQPDSGQQRITFTLPLINHARRITFLVTGESKAGMVSGVLKQTTACRQLPAAQVQPERGYVEWYLDSMAAAMI